SLWTIVVATDIVAHGQEHRHSAQAETRVLHPRGGGVARGSDGGGAPDGSLGAVSQDKGGPEHEPVQRPADSSWQSGGRPHMRRNRRANYRPRSGYHATRRPTLQARIDEAH